MYSRLSNPHRDTSYPSSMIIEEDCVPTGSRCHGEPRDEWSVVGDNFFNHIEGCRSMAIHCEVSC